MSSYKRNTIKLFILGLFVILAAAVYMTNDVKFDNPEFFKFSMKIRIPKLVAMMLAAFTIGASSIVFQSIINNMIVTPCLLGMNGLYTLMHTAVFFFLGSASYLATNKNASFTVDLILMVTIAAFVYGYIFKKTKYNVLYVLLIGTVLSQFFGSMQNSMILIMDPNEYDALLTSLVASFDNVNSEIIIFCILLFGILIFFLRKDIALLDVITLGKNQAVNLGVDYDKTVKRLLIGVCICISIATAMVGPISFLGLIIANVSRQFIKTFRHTHLMLSSSLVGMFSLGMGQVIVEHIFNYTIPVSVFISISGGIYFLYLLLKQTKNLKGINS